MIRIYYKAMTRLDLETMPYIIAKGQLFTAYEIRKYRLERLVDTMMLKPVKVDHRKTYKYFYDFRFEKGEG